MEFRVVFELAQSVKNRRAYVNTEIGYLLRQLRVPANALFGLK